MPDTSTTAEKQIFMRAAILAALLHISLAVWLVMDRLPTPPMIVLGVMEFELYDPLGGNPGGPAEPVSAEAPSSPKPVVIPEPEPELEAPQEDITVIESVSAKAEPVAPPPPTVVKSKPKPKPKPPQQLAQPNSGNTSNSEGTSEGTQLGSGQGGVGGGTGHGNPNALAAYKTTVKRKLERYKKYPNAARSAHLEGVVTVSFTINRDGKVVAYEMVKSAGNNILDDEAEALLRRVSPFPSFPEELSDNTITLTAPIQFALR